MASSQALTHGATLAGRHAPAKCAHAHARTHSAALPPRVLAWTPLSRPHRDLPQPSTPCGPAARCSVGRRAVASPTLGENPTGKSPCPPGSYDSAFVGCPAALLLLPHPPRSGAALPEERRQRRLTGPPAGPPHPGGGRLYCGEKAAFPPLPPWVSHHVDSQGGLRSTSP